MKELYLDVRHQQVEDREGHPRCICWAEYGNNPGGEEQLHYDEYLNTWYCGGCGSSFPQPEKETTAEVMVPMLIDGKIVKVKV